MATAVTLAPALGPTGDALKGCFVATWSGLANGESGDEIQFPNMDIVSIHAFGTFASAMITMEGENTDSGANWATMRDSAGTNLTFTAAGIKVAEGPVTRMRPSVAGGGGTTSVSVVALLVSRTKG